MSTRRRLLADGQRVDLIDGDDCGDEVSVVVDVDDVERHIERKLHDTVQPELSFLRVNKKFDVEAGKIVVVLDDDNAGIVAIFIASP